MSFFSICINLTSLLKALTMESNSVKKKIDRKTKKLQHIVTKETNVILSLTPTKILAICNAGLVNGLTEESVINNFSKFGGISNVVLIPGKSCSFVSFNELSSSIVAFETCHGKLNIAQDKKPIYLAYVEDLPKFNIEKSWNNLPPGLIILEDFINEQEEATLLNLCSFEQTMKNRQVKHFGYEFRYDINNVDKNCPLSEGIPKECDFLWNGLKKYEIDFQNFIPDQLTINYYKPGQGIPNHVDTHSAFEDPIMSLSLQSSVIMDFKDDKDKHYCVLLPRRSLAIISGEARYNWTHGIAPRKLDVVFNTKTGSFDTLERSDRISFTFRKILRGICKCSYPEMCDSQSEVKNDSKIDNSAAVDLEKTHVHHVYENIANHFSDTRHKPWPNVQNFINSLECGSVLIDIGCGNGKYLGLNQSIYSVGCDRSFGLLEVCNTRGFQIFNCNCLSIPLKDNTADAAISIAVFHHLANEERRLKAIEEMVRVLKIGGKGLIYVWAKNQSKDNKDSNYLKSCKVDNEEKTVTLDKVSLPVHTNRTNFQHKDLLVPWKLKKNGESEPKDTFLRFYHVFEENELETLCGKLGKVVILKSYYDQGNWCVIIEKNKS